MINLAISNEPTFNWSFMHVFFQNYPTATWEGVAQVVFREEGKWLLKSKTP